MALFPTIQPGAPPAPADTTPQRSTHGTPVAEHNQATPTNTPVPTAPAQETAAPPLDTETLKEAAQDLQDALAKSRPEEWHVAIHEDETTGTIVIEIKDADGEVIKQFPPENLLNLQRKMADLAGVVIDETT